MHSEDKALVALFDGLDTPGVSDALDKLGLPGLLLFIAATWSWWKETRPRTRNIDLNADNAIWLGTTAGLLAALFSGLFDHYFSFQPVLVGLFWLMIGLNLQEARRLREEAEVLPGAPAGNAP